MSSEQKRKLKYLGIGGIIGTIIQILSFFFTPLGDVYDGIRNNQVNVAQTLQF